MSALLSWLITSSADPLRTSLMLRGIAVGLIPYAMTILDGACQLGLACLGVDVDWFNMLVEFVTKGAELILFGIAGAMTLIGLGRKLYLARWSAK